MAEVGSPESVQVTCYSGRVYADRPVSFIWQGVGYEIKKVEKEWQQPSERLFVVGTKDEKRFRLCYNEGQDQWSITEVL